MYLGKSGVGEGVIVGGTVAVGDGGGELVVSAAAVWATVVVGRGVNVGWALDVGEEATVGDTVCGCMTLSSAVLALLLQAANSNSSVENSSILDSARKVNGTIVYVRCRDAGGDLAAALNPPIGRTALCRDCNSGLS